MKKVWLLFAECHEFKNVLGVFRLKKDMESFLKEYKKTGEYKAWYKNYWSEPWLIQ